MALYYADINQINRVHDNIEQEVGTYIQQVNQGLDKAQEKLTEVAKQFDTDVQQAIEDYNAAVDEYQAKMKQYQDDLKAYNDAMAEYQKSCSDAAAEAAKNGESYTAPPPPNITPPNPPEPPEKPQIDYEGKANLEAAVENVMSIIESCNTVLTQVDTFCEKIGDVLTRTISAEDEAARILRFDFDRVLDGAKGKAAGILGRAWEGNYVDDNYRYDSKPMEYVTVIDENGKSKKVYVDTLVCESMVGGIRVVDEERTSQQIADMLARFGDTEENRAAIAQALGYSTIPIDNAVMEDILVGAGVADENIRFMFDIAVDARNAFQEQENDKFETGKQTYQVTQGINNFNEKWDENSDNLAWLTSSLGSLQSLYAQAEELGDEDLKNQVAGLIDKTETGIANTTVSNALGDKKLSEMSDEELAAYYATIQNLNVDVDRLDPALKEKWDNKVTAVADRIAKNTLSEIGLNDIENSSEAQNDIDKLQALLADENLSSDVRDKIQSRLDNVDAVRLMCAINEFDIDAYASRQEAIDALNSLKAEINARLSKGENLGTNIIKYLTAAAQEDGVIDQFVDGLSTVYGLNGVGSYDSTTGRVTGIATQVASGATCDCLEHCLGYCLQQVTGQSYWNYGGVGCPSTIYQGGHSASWASRSNTPLTSEQVIAAMNNPNQAVIVHMPHTYCKKDPEGYPSSEHWVTVYEWNGDWKSSMYLDPWDGQVKTYQELNHHYKHDEGDSECMFGEADGFRIAQAY